MVSLKSRSAVNWFDILNAYFKWNAVCQSMHFGVTSIQRAKVVCCNISMAFYRLLIRQFMFTL